MDQGKVDREIHTDEVFGPGWYELPKWYQVALDAIADSDEGLEEVITELESCATNEHQRRLCACLRWYQNGGEEQPSRPVRFRRYLERGRN